MVESAVPTKIQQIDDQEDEINMKLLDALYSQTDSKKDRVFCCVFGAFIGDALGGPVEFQFTVDQEDLDDAMNMQGGGVWRLMPGQITDDSEMAMSILRGLTDPETNITASEVTKILNLDGITYYFGKWRESAFDIGKTTKRALSVIGIDSNGKQVELYKRHSYTPKVFAQVKEHNNGTSNGSLMRLSPFAVWCRNLSGHDLYNAVKLQTRLTHNSAFTIEVCYLYCYCIKQLIDNNGNARQAYTETVKEAKRRKDTGLVQEDLLYMFTNIENNELPSTTENQGTLTVALSYTFYYLYKAMDRIDFTDYYAQCMRDMISKGGDTDTNAAIVGGVIGALVGIKNIPLEYSQKILLFKPNRARLDIPSQRRPDFVLARKGLIPMLEQVYKDAPAKLKAQYDQKVYTNVKISELMKLS